MDTKNPCVRFSGYPHQWRFKTQNKNIQNQTGQSEAETLDYEVGVNQC